MNNITPKPPAAASPSRSDRPEKIRCDACPVLCYIAEGRSGACDRYANVEGVLTRVDPLVILNRRVAEGGAEGGGVVSFLDEGRAWEGDIVAAPDRFVTAVGAGTTYPDYKPAPFIVSSRMGDTDMVTVVTEGIFSYCGVKVKVDTDRHLGPETAAVRYRGEAVGHVTTAEYGSQMMSLGGVHHLTGGSKKEGRATCEALLALCNRQSVELEIDGGVRIEVAAGQPPVIDGEREERMRVGCGSAAIGMFAQQWFRHVDEVVVVDDHITGVLSEHQAGKLLDVPATGIKIRGHKSTPGRYFRVASPGQGWGGTDIVDPLSIIDRFEAKQARPGLRLLMVSTTGDHAAYFELDEELLPVETAMPDAVAASVARIQENCEPAMCSVVFIGGAGGSLRAGVTENPVKLTRSVRNTLTQVTSGGAEVYLWPGGGITYMVDVMQMPENAFGYVPTPALVAPIEFTMRLSDYAALGGHMGSVRTVDEVAATAKDDERTRAHATPPGRWPVLPHRFGWAAK